MDQWPAGSLNPGGNQTEHAGVTLSQVRRAVTAANQHDQAERQEHEAQGILPAPLRRAAPRGEFICALLPTHPKVGSAGIRANCTGYCRRPVFCGSDASARWDWIASEGQAPPWEAVQPELGVDPLGHL